MTYVLNLSHVSLQRGDTQVLSDVSWSTRPRQHWVIVGPNGAGKTTLARVASGRITPDSGEVTVSETDLAHADPADVATRVGLASAAVAAKIVPTQSVLDTVRSAAWGLCVAHDEEYEEVDDQRASTLMEIFGVAHLSGIRVREIRVRHAHLARIGRDPARDNASEGRFARSVGTDDDPMLARTRRPRDVGQDLCVSSSKRHMREI